MYLVKQIVGAFAMPMFIALWLVIVGIACHWARRRRAALCLYVLAASLVYLSAIAPVANLLLSPLEHAYPPIRGDQLPPGVVAIVVLGGSYEPRDGIPVTAALEPDSLARIVEGVRLKVLHSDLRLVVSGGAPAGQATSAAGYSELARGLGVPAASVVMLPDSLDTGDEARNVARLLAAAPFLLVTSAYHMPRAMRLMERAGTHPIAAPTGQLVGPGRLSLLSLVPSASVLRRTERALHEYVGLGALMVGMD